MKKKLLLLLTLAITSAMLLISCGSMFGGDNSQDEKTDPKSYNKIVYDDPALDILSIRAAMSDIIGPSLSTYLYTDASASDGEVVFGNSDRTITAAAKSALAEALSKDSKNDCGYIIYVDGKNIAVYWDVEGMGDIAVQAFIDVCVNDKRLVLDNGTVLSQHYDKHTFETEKYWLALEAVADEDVVEAIKRLYNYYDGTKLIGWLGNLYDPEVGGFYFSNSARDTKGFLPDIESTSQLLGMVVNIGALPSRDALPEEIKHKIVDFAKSLQSADDGYFYHPQWPIGRENLLTERYGRDLGNATGVITAIKFDTDGDGVYETQEYPNYCAPNGVKCALHNGTGDKCSFPVATAYLTDTLDTPVTTTLTSSVSSAVSKLNSSVVTATAAAGSTPDYSSATAFRNWLESYNSTMTENSGNGHQLAALASEITQKGYANVVLDYLDEVQAEVFDTQVKNGETPTGLWQYNVDYNLVYGLLKWGVFHNSSSHGRAIGSKYIPYIVRSCIEVTKLPPSDNYRMHDLYNQWTSVQTLVKNVKRFYGTGSEELNTIYTIMRESAAEIIENSISKIDPFKIGDGSYAHNNDCLSNTEIYGTPIAMGVKEGDVNATALCVGMYLAIFDCLGYKKVPLCTSDDGAFFIETLVESEPIEKKKADTKTLDFESGVITSNIDKGFSNSASTIEIVNDPIKNDNKVLSFISVGGGTAGDYLYFDTFNRGTNPSCNIFEMDFYISSESDENYLLEIMVGKGYMLEMKLEGEEIVINDRSKLNNVTTRNEIARVSVDEWHRIRVEQYRYDAEENGIDSPKMKIWIDKEFYGVSENCYYWSGGTTSNAYGEVSILSLKTPYTHVYFDNVFCSTENKIYNPNDATISDFRDALMDE
ncbi:MAG: hypothetical protein IJW03_03435 [Clostridia bacterium]|nr:hypothetical protein [Clostridia bacterium]